MSDTPESNRTTMPTWMRQFLENLAVKCGHTPKEVRWAAEECIRIAAALPTHRECVPSEGIIALNLTSEPEPVEAPVVEPTPVPAVTAPTAAAPIVAQKTRKAAPAASAASVQTGSKMKITRITINGVPFDTTSWVEAMVKLTQTVIDEGKGNQIPTVWFKDSATDDAGRRICTQLPDGRWYCTNLSGVNGVLSRVKRLAPMLGSPVTITYTVDDMSQEMPF